jgi:hypothetical protein
MLDVEVKRDDRMRSENELLSVYPGWCDKIRVLCLYSDN